MSFDRIIERRGTGSLKWDLRPDLDPFWVADMDFASPQPVIDALARRVQDGVFGYPTPHRGLNEAVLEYLSVRHQYRTTEDEIVHLGGLVPALSLAGRAFCKSDGEILTCHPVYPPFLDVGKDGNLNTIRVEHVREDGRWTFDWEALEKAATKSTRVFFLCNPQNPLGRCFTEKEITRIGEFCLRRGILLVSDEIHCDLVLDEAKTPFFSALHLPEEMRQNSIVLLSPSKTYNIAGLGYAYAVIKNPKVRGVFTSARGHTLPEVNCLAYYAAEAAYRDGSPWREELIAYLRGNRDALTSFVHSNLPEIIVPDIEATYLAWMDCSKLGLKNPAQHFEKAGVFVSDGAYFRATQHIRFNFGCPRSRMIEGLEKIQSAID